MGCSGSKQAVKENATTTEPTAGAGDKTLLQQKPVDVKDEVKEELAPTVAEPIAESLPGQPVLAKVVILSARGLRNADWVGKSDPYCTLEIAGKPTPEADGKADSSFSTKVVDNSLTPEWNHEIDVGHYCVGDSFTFTVKDSDPLKLDDPLGKVTVTSDQFFEDGFEGELQLADDVKGSEAFLRVRIAVVHPKVTVGIVSARGLRNADWIGKSDPFCICEITGKAEATFSTKVVTDQLAPVWNQESVMPFYRVNDALSFIVKDSDPLKPDDFLGNFTLTHDQFFPSGFFGEVQLADAGDGCEAFLTIKVVVGEKVEQALDAVDPITVEAVKDDIVDTAAEVVVQEDLVETKVAPTGLCCGSKA